MKKLNEKLERVTRVEVIDDTGRKYVNWEVDNVIISLQDAGRTMKIFIDNSDSKPKQP